MDRLRVTASRPLHRNWEVTKFNLIYNNWKRLVSESHEPVAGCASQCPRASAGEPAAYIVHKSSRRRLGVYAQQDSAASTISTWLKRRWPVRRAGFGVDQYEMTTTRLRDRSSELAGRHSPWATRRLALNCLTLGQTHDKLHVTLLIIQYCLISFAAAHSETIFTLTHLLVYSIQYNSYTV